MRHVREAAALGALPAVCLAGAAFIYLTPAILGFAAAALAAAGWCWWTDAHPAG
jgi:hypothetical protein